MLGIKTEEKLAYGVKEDIDKRYLYVNKITLENYEDDENVKNCMRLLSDKALFYQYNSGDKDATECDYFFWHFIPMDDFTLEGDKEHACWGHVEISIYNDAMDYDYKMRKLIDFIKFNMCGINLKMIIEYGDARDLIEKIDSKIYWENDLKKRKESAENGK